MENESIPYTRKIRIYPTETQKIFFNKCFGVSRYIYNQCIDHLNQKNKINFYDMRKKIVTKSDKKWLKEIPYDTCQLVVKNFVANYKSCMTNYKHGNISNFKMTYKSKKCKNSVFYVDHRALKPDLILFKKQAIGKIIINNKDKKWLNENITNILKHDFTIMKNNINNYYMCLSLTKTHIIKEPLYSIASLDPGIRTFNTLYSPDGLVGKLGDGFAKNIYKMAIHNDKLKSYIQQNKNINKHTKYNINKKCCKLRTKIYNKTCDLHWKTASWLVKNFQTILLPKFEVSRMVKKLPHHMRTIGSESVRNMLSLSHYKFKERLTYMANVYNRNLIIVNESYTSKTCGNCGTLNLNLKGNKIFNCDKCKINIDRDYNGARNILLKNIGFDAVH